MKNHSMAAWRLRIKLVMAATFIIAGMSLQLLQMMKFLRVG